MDKSHSLQNNLAPRRYSDAPIDAASVAIEDFFFLIELLFLIGMADVKKCLYLTESILIKKGSGHLYPRLECNNFFLFIFFRWDPRCCKNISSIFERS